MYISKREKMNENIKKDMSLERRRRALAMAFLQRAKKAGIPNHFLRINKDSFRGLLSEEYHQDTLDSICDFIYDTPLKLSKIPFIVIDGGGIEDRKKAGFAILFRLITIDRFGKYYDCSNIAHKLSTWNDVNGIGRNELVEDLKRYDVLFISEFQERLGNPHCQTGTFFDEFLNDRSDKENPTIITFTSPINSQNAIKTMDCGQYLAGLSMRLYPSSYLTETGALIQGDVKNNPSKNILRLRVKRSF